jgi:enoyl-CoA hydratase/carnithine racemase
MSSPVERTKGTRRPEPPERNAGAAHESDSLIKPERDARGVITLTLNRPQAFNALSGALLSALQRELDALEGDERARVLVLAGAGKAFCAGHDLREMRAQPSLEYYQRLFTQCTRMMLSLRRLPIPVIARVHGIATAAGCQLVAQCDLAVASREARFAVSGVNLGLFCSSPGVPLSRNVPLKPAFEMLVTGDFIDAEAARERGLVNRVVAPDALDAEVESLVAGILRKPRVTIALGKELFYRQAELGLAAAYEAANRTMACNMMESAALEGVQAFLEKRTPRWE